MDDRGTGIVRGLMTIEELRKRASRELILNSSITVYDFVDGVEVNRRRPRLALPFHRFTEHFLEMQDVIQGQLFAGLTDTTAKFRELGEAFRADR